MDSAIKLAHEEVMRNRKQVENAFGALEDKIQLGRSSYDQMIQRYDHAVETIRTPMRLAREYPFASFLVCLGIGFFFGSRVSKRGYGNRSLDFEDVPHGLRRRLPLYDADDLADEWGSKSIVGAAD